MTCFADVGCVAGKAPRPQLACLVPWGHKTLQLQVYLGTSQALVDAGTWDDWRMARPHCNKCTAIFLGGRCRWASWLNPDSTLLLLARGTVLWALCPGCDSCAGLPHCVFDNNVQSPWHQPLHQSHGEIHACQAWSSLLVTGKSYVDKVIQRITDDFLIWFRIVYAKSWDLYLWTFECLYARYLVIF